MGTKNRNYQQEIKAVLESSWGTTPAESLEIFKVTGFDDGRDKVFSEDNEFHSDGQPVGQQGIAEKANVNVDFKVRFCGVMEDIFRSAIRSDADFVSTSISASDIAFNATDNALSSTSTNFFSNNMSIGQIVLITGITDTSSLALGIGRVTALAAKKVTLAIFDANVKAAGATVTVKGSYMRNGNTVNSMSWERQLTAATLFYAYTGMVVDSMGLTFENGAEAKGRINIKGEKIVRSGTTIGTGADTAAATTTPFECNAGVVGFFIDGSAIAVSDKRFALNLANGLIMDDELGSQYPTGIGLSEFNCTADLQVYNEDGTLYDAWLAETAEIIDFIIKDSASNYYAFSLFKAQAVTEPKVEAGNKDGSCMLSCTLRGFKGAGVTEPAKILQITKIAA